MQVITLEARNADINPRFTTLENLNCNQWQCRFQASKCWQLGIVIQLFRHCCRWNVFPGKELFFFPVWEQCFLEHNETKPLELLLDALTSSLPCTFAAKIQHQPLPWFCLQHSYSGTSRIVLDQTIKFIDYQRFVIHRFEICMFICIIIQRLYHVDAPPSFDCMELRTIRALQDNAPQTMPSPKLHSCVLAPN